MELRKKYDAQFVVFDSPNTNGEANEPAVVGAGLMADVVAAAMYS